MKQLWTALLVLALVVTSGFGLAQDDSDGTDHSQHDSQSETDHDEMDHSQHGAEDMSGEALNVVLVGDSSLTLEPLISAEGVLTLGVRVEPPAELSLSVTSPGGQEIALNAVPVMSKTGGMKDEPTEESHEGAEGEGHGDEMSDNDTKGDHGDDNAASGHSGHDMDVAAGVRQTLAFEVGVAETGVWRFSGAVDGEDISFPVSVYKMSEDGTDVYLTLAPSPALSTHGLSETFVYAFKDGEPVHSGMMVNRAMAGMEHSTDDEQLNLVHNHFNDVYNDTLGYGPMASQSPLGFAMAGTWDVTVMIMGEDEQAIAFDVEVLDE